jgi:hypothetical protein
LDGIAPVIACLFDRERGIGTDSVVNNVNELCIPLLRNASGEYYLLDSFLFKLVSRRKRLIDATVAIQQLTI